MLLQMLTIFFISMPQITYAFANNSEQLVNEKVLGHVLLEGISNFHPFFCGFLASHWATIRYPWKYSDEMIILTVVTTV